MKMQVLLASSSGTIHNNKSHHSIMDKRKEWFNGKYGRQERREHNGTHPRRERNGQDENHELT